MPKCMANALVNGRVPGSKEHTFRWRYTHVPVRSQVTCDNIGTWRLRYIWDQFRYTWFLQYTFGTSLCQFRYMNMNVKFKQMRHRYIRHFFVFASLN